MLTTLHLAAPARAGGLPADPHPGNFLLLPDGRLGVLDFGSVARLPNGLRPSWAGSSAPPSPVTGGRRTPPCARRGSCRPPRRSTARISWPTSSPRCSWSSGPASASAVPGSVSRRLG
ncbi:AarF/UbiB family protein [Micromonospora sp. NPDC053740]|uniref:AarF/UbiB family protein n=1 Tax=Micromonospora sp. NPDC053740 TaxID=3155173 RepID=UPI003439F377